MPKSKPAKAAKKSKKASPTRASKKPAKRAKVAKSAARKSVAKKPVSKKPAAKARPHGKPAAQVNGAKTKTHKPVKLAKPAPQVQPPKPIAKAKKVKLTPFLEKQKDRLLQLRDSLLDSMSGVAKDTLRSRAEGSEASAFGMHQADAGSDSYDRDFALSLLSQEQDALYEIEEALKRIDAGTYGVCEMSGKPIAHARLEALPFARYTVECQSQFERQKRIAKSRAPVTSLFGLTDDDGEDEAEEETTTTETKKEEE
jgi:RNA polymerase-binding transcription factor DksA